MANTKAEFLLLHIHSTMHKMLTMSLTSFGLPHTHTHTMTTITVTPTTARYIVKNEERDIHKNKEPKNSH